MKLQDWVYVNKLDQDYLSTNPNAMEILKENPDKIDWVLLSLNHLYI